MRLEKVSELTRLGSALPRNGPRRIRVFADDARITFMTKQELPATGRVNELPVNFFAALGNQIVNRTRFAPSQNHRMRLGVILAGLGKEHHNETFRHL